MNESVGPVIPVSAGHAPSDPSPATAPPVVIAHLMSSPFFGGPERQMVGMAASLPNNFRSVFLIFAEGGRYRALADQVRARGMEAVVLEQNFPRVRRAAREIASHLVHSGAHVLCCSGYKPDIIGWLAARRAGVPVVSVSHGWTAATARVRLYEALDRWVIRRMDATVAVSEGQAARVRRAGVSMDRVVVIRNATGTAAHSEPDPAYRAQLRGLFPVPPARIVGAAGRLSWEKGFDQLIEAAYLIAPLDQEIGFVLFGDGRQRRALERRIAARGLAERFILAGFEPRLEQFLPHLDVLALPSYSEGLPVILLEALAAGVPVVATAVGGSPEVIEDGVHGYLVPPGDPEALARRILDTVRDEGKRSAMGRRGQDRVRDKFTFQVQGAEYRGLFQRLAELNMRA